tara:strand:+ start:5311 stop:7155 length:1845 start_codon:yes stop_codon:yes gene_type:complete
MELLTLDFETYYAQDYTLGKLTTEAYIRDERFEVIGVSVSRDSSPPEWFSGTHAETKKFLDKYDWGNAVACAHNAVFDMAILNWVFDIRPKRIVDTLSMARAIHGTEVGGSLKALAEHYRLGVKGTEVIQAKGKRRIDFTADELAAYGGYCCNDTALTSGLFAELLAEGDGFPMDELKLIDATIRMFSEPVLELNGDYLEMYHSHVIERKEELLSQLGIDKKYLMSNAILAQMLSRAGVTPPTKISPTTGKETFAFAKTDEDFKALLEHDKNVVQTIVSTRLGVKSTIEETRAKRFMEVASRGNLPVPLRYYAAHTGRWGGDDKINMQNLSRKSKIKNAILAPEGYLLVDSDLSQIEARMLAMLAGQLDLVEAFEQKEDVYKIMAASIYGKAVADITDSERFVGKQTILGCGYGMGAAKFQSQLKVFNVDLPLEECQRIIRVYRESYPMIPKLWKAAGEALKAIIADRTSTLGPDSSILVVDGVKGIKLPNGLHMKYPNLRYSKDEDSGRKEMVYDSKKGRAVMKTRIYGGKCIENVCQALARIVVGEQILRVNRKYRVAMTVHDSIIAVIPEHEIETGKEYVELCMRIRPTWAPQLPLDCEAFHGKTYGGCKK